MTAVIKMSLLLIAVYVITYQGLGLAVNYIMNTYEPPVSASWTKLEASELPQTVGVPFKDTLEVTTSTFQNQQTYDEQPAVSPEGL